jgi:hypothetical protein
MRLALGRASSAKADTEPKAEYALVVSSDSEDLSFRIITGASQSHFKNYFFDHIRVRRHATPSRPSQFRFRLEQHLLTYLLNPDAPVIESLSETSSEGVQSVNTDRQTEPSSEFAVISSASFWWYYEC